LRLLTGGRDERALYPSAERNGLEMLYCLLQRLLVLTVAVLPLACGHGGSRRSAVDGSSRPQQAFVFASDRTGAWAPYADNLSASALTPLLKRLPGLSARSATDESGASLSEGLAWSPDGSKVAVGGVDALWIVDLTTGATLKLRYGFGPTWSADGTKLVYEDNFSTYVVNSNGTDRRKLVDESSTSSSPAISPNGAQVAYDAGNGIAIVPATGGAPRLIAPYSEGVVDALSWSPSGDAIAYSVGSGRGAYVVRPDGSDRRRIAVTTPSSSDIVSLAWSPDGGELATTCGLDLCRVNRDGSDALKLTHSFAGEASFAPAWSPDGSEIAYLRGRGGPEGTDVFVVKVDGTDNHPLTSAFPDGGNNVAVAWRTAPIHLVQHNPPLHMIDVAPTRSISDEDVVTHLSALGSRSAFTKRAVNGDNSCAVGLWTPQIRTKWRNLCWSNGFYGHEPGQPLPIRSGAAWVRVSWARYSENDELVLAKVGRKPSIVHHRRPNPLEANFVIGRPVMTPLGIEFSSQSGSAMTLWRVVGRRQVVVAKRLERGVLESAYRNLLAVLTRRGEILVLTDDGRLTARFNGHRVANVAISAGGIFGITQSNVLERWTPLGRRLRAYQLVRRATSAAHLEDADGQCVAYAAGAAVHLFRLSNGRDVVVSEPMSAEPVHAQLERAGLYLSYDEKYSQMTGRVMFFPRAEIERLLMNRA
jgi:WD40 repeat protein